MAKLALFGDVCKFITIIGAKKGHGTTVALLILNLDDGGRATIHITSHVETGAGTI